MLILLYTVASALAGFIAGCWFVLRMTQVLEQERARLSDGPIAREIGS